MVGDPRGIQYLGHEDEQGHRHQDVVLHHPVGPGGHEVHHHVHVTQAQYAEDHPDDAQGEGQRMAEEDDQRQGDEHADGNGFGRHISSPFTL